MLKIDKTFLDLDNRNRGTLIRAVTELGHTLGLTVVAEGVETAEQLAHVRAASCDAAQGYLLARPMPEAAARQYLEGSGPDKVALQPASIRAGREANAGVTMIAVTPAGRLRPR